jgi:hypothetical protein
MSKLIQVWIEQDKKVNDTKDGTAAAAAFDGAVTAVAAVGEGITDETKKKIVYVKPDKAVTPVPTTKIVKISNVLRCRTVDDKKNLYTNKIAYKHIMTIFLKHNNLQITNDTINALLKDMITTSKEQDITDTIDTYKLNKYDKLICESIKELCETGQKITNIDNNTFEEFKNASKTVCYLTLYSKDKTETLYSAEKKLNELDTKVGGGQHGGAITDDDINRYLTSDYERNEYRELYRKSQRHGLGQLDFSEKAKFQAYEQRIELMKRGGLTTTIIKKAVDRDALTRIGLYIKNISNINAEILKMAEP